MKDGLVVAKYEVSRTDGFPLDPGIRLFILSPDTDPYAKRALCYYAMICAETHPILAGDIAEAYGLDCKFPDGE